MAMTGRATALREQGMNIVGFTAGEPDFDTPAHIIAAAATALRRGFTRYTPVAGATSLREAVALQSSRIRGVSQRVAEVIIGTGAKQILYNFFMAVLNEGDEVLIPAPYWVSYPDQVRLAGGVPVIIPTVEENRWVPSTDAIARAITPKTRVLVLNSPSNPSGVVYPRAAMTAIVRCALENGLWILSDEIYRDLVYGEARFCSPLSVAVDSRERIVVVDGVSKTFAMTGFRLGWGIAHPDVIAAMATIQGQSTSCASSIAQEAARAAIEGPMDFLPAWRDHYVARRDMLVAGLNRIAGMQCATPDGAFYVLPHVTGAAARLAADATDLTLSEFLLEKAGVATVPGTPFGAPGYLRLSYAVSEQTIAEGLRRIEAALA
jgi:aspartate aminotransferase